MLLTRIIKKERDNKNPIRFNRKFYKLSTKNKSKTALEEILTFKKSESLPLQ